MRKQDENKAVVGRWFTEFWGKEPLATGPAPGRSIVCDHAMA